MKCIIERLLINALSQLQAEGKIPSCIDSKIIKVDRTKDSSHGDWSCNLAFVLSKVCNKAAKHIAEWIVAAIPADDFLDKIAIAGPGFINFFMKPEALSQIVLQVLEEGENFGKAHVPTLQPSELNLYFMQYVQYAHARICTVFRQFRASNLSIDKKMGLQKVNLLTEPQELALLVQLGHYPEIVALAANTSGSSQISHYLQELASGLHRYYNEIQLLCEDEMQRQARLCLLVAVRHVLKNGLQLLGVSSPESV